MWSDWPEDATHDRLIGDWFFYQRKGGHRTSTDDVLVAWLASRLFADTPPSTYIDIGCGIGSVLLMTAHRVRPTQSYGLEAQEQSATMAHRSVQELPENAPPITIIHGDLRAPDAFSMQAELVTGSPPYFPLGTGVLSPDPQRVACRFEVRGGVEAYLEAAARLLKDDGVFCLVFIASELARVEAAAAQVGLVEFHRVLWKTREDHAEYFLSVHAFCRASSPRAAVPRVEEFAAVRNAKGAHTDAYRELRQFMGWSSEASSEATRES